MKDEEALGQRARLKSRLLAGDRRTTN